MKIAFYISPSDTLPPSEKRILAPWFLAQNIIQGLVSLGHDLMVFAAQGSSVPCQLVTLGIEPTLKEKMNLSAGEYYQKVFFAEGRLCGEAISLGNKGKFNIIHVFHGTLRVLPVLNFSQIPVVCTLHDPISDNNLAHYQAFAYNKNIFYSAISQSQKKSYNLPFAGVVYHGINIKEISFNEKSGDNLLISGRIVKEKGIKTAIEVAKKSKKTIMIIGQYFLDDPRSVSYWLNEVLPLIDNKSVKYEGFKSPKVLHKSYSQAKAMLLPIEWEEPFGLVMIESMACGTPVIAYARGSVPEVVSDGETGFIVNSSDDDIRGDWIIKKTGEEGLREAIEKINAMTPDQYQSMRRACRARVEKLFTVERMVSNYEQLYKKILQVST